MDESDTEQSRWEIEGGGASDAAATVERLETILGLSIADREVGEKQLEQLAVTIDAALAADRQEGVKVLMERSMELAAAQAAEKWLGELLAVIHGDGGHYQSEHGTEKATKDAIIKRTEMVRRIDQLESQLAAAQAAMQDALDYYKNECSGYEPSLSVFHRKLDNVFTSAAALNAAIAAAYDHARKEADRDWQDVLDTKVAAATKPLVDWLTTYREWWNEIKVEYPAFFRNFKPPEPPAFPKLNQTQTP